MTRRLSTLTTTRTMTTSEYWFGIEPVPASRPRFRAFTPKGRKAPIVTTYHAGRYKEFLTQAETAIPPADHLHEGALRVSVTAAVTKPRTSKRSYPRGDADNFVKGILDVMTRKGYWNDDDQIVSLEIVKVFTVDYGTWRTQAGFKVEVEELGSNITGGTS